MEKYLIASAGDTLDSKVSGRFGHSGYFLVVNPQNMEFDAFPGIGNDESQGIGRFINLGIKKVIVGNIGPSAYNEVTSSGCKVYLCRNMSVLEAIKKVESGSVQVLKEPTLKASIHSARKAGDGYGGRGEGRRTGKGFETGLKGSKGMGKGMGSGMGKGMGRGMGGGMGKGMGGGKGRGGGGRGM
ncbi:MAG: NifB/NifX family molybdenum-iron cluster-binding protein [Bacteroidales bacterium]|nr:NifB/NifX family molybdenum-iron cluster-binding protein [Bacteroidales bacterium]